MQATELDFRRRRGEKVVAELDSALNAWIATTPEHLRWDNFAHPKADPSPEDAIFFEQSAMLHASFYCLQIYVHCQYLPMVRKRTRDSVQTLPSLAICTNASRATSRILHVQRERNKGRPVPEVTPFAFAAGLILVINVWSASHTAGLPPHMNSTIEQVQQLIEVVRVCEDRWLVAGLFYDILSELASVPEPPKALSNSPTAMPSKKRGRHSSEARTTASVPTPFGRDGLTHAMAAGHSAKPATNEVHEWLSHFKEMTATSPFGLPDRDAPMAPWETDEDVMAIWGASLPTGLNLDDWSSYFSTMSQFNSTG
ncbi:Zn(2)-C6 fungal-type domain-containing protein [Mycena indigotica]|uniref:Zn(2)-C6 fungal-type domain-containing protein n=1 Tax=Mycena indigotica TaxID=2126181 RepID=A0A8H6TEV0_9AGAR|nr:Zn(2)-C6 fungal-type domain-containing protein [Mycena indigotica]KAF7316215.1 Zn(2)-C6 fungal-type domain-containing protein [Mycena indigotica]